MSGSRVDTVLKLSLSLAALLAGGGVGFYYGIYLPSQDLHRQTQEMVEQQDSARVQTKALADRARREKAAQVAYEDCNNAAELTYKNHWAAACRAQHAADVAAFEDCADNLFATEKGCLRDHPIRPERECALTTRLADRLVEERDGARQECVGRLREMQAASADDAPVPAS
ncbi:hypothetical protein I5E68_00345 [Novosphingobium sp. YJ-S2-02]|uniref:Uncharacterized protein n=1 Tax=Novosphingobium aureum TaxID=2792964 RepID=A0A931MJ68_9SPHN|nr:hypothetical protein [Novosphingobium aureum]MBH0111398.1 hypothetical protein [Novosphingobium aureum]